jgi:hypothetical protein
VAYTPILDAAVCAYLAADTPIRGVANTHERIAAALRAALPWEPPAERLEAMARAAFRFSGEPPQGYIRAVLAAYRANPIMRELYPEKFR